MTGNALVPAPVARLNRGLLGLRVSLYAVVLFGLWQSGVSPWVLVGVAAVVAFPAIRHPLLFARRVHLGVASSIILELALWIVYGPLPGLEYVPIVSVSVAALVLSPRAGFIAWIGAVCSQAVAVFIAAIGRIVGDANLVSDEIVALVLLVMVGPAFRGIAAVLSELRDELAETVKEQTRLTEIVAEKDRFLEGAAHTLRTPLTGVLGLAEVVDGGDLDPVEQRELVRTIVSEGRRLVRAVDNVIVGSRLPMGLVELLSREIDLAAAADAAAGRATVQGSAVGIGDPARLMTVIGNLVDNGEAHGRGRIDIAIWGEDGRAWFEVADEGAGVPLSAREAVFDRYDTRGAPPTQPASLGLGLPVSRQLLRAMGGDLACIGDGNRFRGWLPLAAVDAMVTRG